MLDGEVAVIDAEQAALRMQRVFGATEVVDDAGEIAVGQSFLGQEVVSIGVKEAAVVGGDAVARVAGVDEVKEDGQIGPDRRLGGRVLRLAPIVDAVQRVGDIVPMTRETSVVRVESVAVEGQ